MVSPPPGTTPGRGGTIRRADGEGQWVVSGSVRPPAATRLAAALGRARGRPLALVDGEPAGEPAAGGPRAANARRAQNFGRSAAKTDQAAAGGRSARTTDLKVGVRIPRGACQHAGQRRCSKGSDKHRCWPDHPSAARRLPIHALAARRADLVRSFLVPAGKQTHPRPERPVRTALPSSPRAMRTTATTGSPSCSCRPDWPMVSSRPGGLAAPPQGPRRPSSKAAPPRQVVEDRAVLLGTTALPADRCPTARRGRY
jgi:hypothetical protein